MDYLMLACLVLVPRTRHVARDEVTEEEKDAWWIGRAEEAL